MKPVILKAQDSIFDSDDRLKVQKIADEVKSVDFKFQPEDNLKNGEQVKLILRVPDNSVPIKTGSRTIEIKVSGLVDPQKGKEFAKLQQGLNDFADKRYPSKSLDHDELYYTKKPLATYAFTEDPTFSESSKPIHVGIVDHYHYKEIVVGCLYEMTSHNLTLDQTKTKNVLVYYTDVALNKDQIDLMKFAADDNGNSKVFDKSQSLASIHREISAKGVKVRE
ncbi:hypothetical protein HU830_02770 [Lactobacillus sp. DCY120]|uniref:Uncharacterized protein n=1 Tax=Bombilactobacillus apium TaxID=2675299 RepID=A0A850R5H9_9LACO|nr:hypothetical protein [Bombilactobacillus apium]NVY96107.1 hypothetical protein [Bombilactobacillus apium]